MCVASNIGDYYKPHWPQFDPPKIWPDLTPAKPINPWSEEKMRKLMELIEKAREMDKLMGEPDCEDPAKTAWMKQVEQRLKKLEKLPK